MLNKLGPLVSVVIPTLNRCRYLEETVKSVLLQTYDNIEIIISDNASVDETQESLNKITDQRVKIIRRMQQMEMNEHWNACLSELRGEFFILVSDDDVLSPRLIEEMVNLLHNSNNSFVYSPYWVVDSDGMKIGKSSIGPTVETSNNFIYAHLRGKRQVIPSATLVRLADFRAFGGFPPVGLMSDLASRLLLASTEPSNVACLGERLVEYRWHGVNASTSIHSAIESLDDFLVWAKGVSVLSGYLSDIRFYVNRLLLTLGVRSALFGVPSDRKNIMKVAEASDMNLIRKNIIKIAISVFGLRFLRVVLVKTNQMRKRFVKSQSILEINVFS